MNRQKSGQPTGGQFAERDRAEADVSLLGRSYPALIIPTPDQERRGREASARAAAWADASGQTDPRTSEDYARELAEQEAAYEAFKRGETHPDDDAFDLMWEGHGPGISRARVESRLEALNEDLTTLAAGDLPDSMIFDVARSDTPHADAADILNARVELYSEALRSRGKSLSVNQAAVQRARKDAERAEAPF